MFIEWKFRRKVHILFIRHFLGRLLRWTVIRYIHDKIIMHIFYVNLWKLHRALTELNHKLWRVLPSTIKMMVCCSGPHFFSLAIISFYRIVITHKSIVPTNREKKNGRWEIMRQWLVILHKAWAKNSLEQFKKCAFNWKLCKKLAISFFSLFLVGYIVVFCILFSTFCYFKIWLSIQCCVASRVKKN